MKQSRKRLLSLLLAVIMVVGILPVMSLAAGDEYAKVTDASKLSAGDKVIIVASDSDFALGTNQKPNNREAVSITKNGDTIIPGTNVQILTLGAGTKEGTFAFNTGSGYLYAAGKSTAQSGSKNQNYLKTETALSDNSSWTISITSAGVASVIAQGENGCNQLKKNSSSALFSAYSSGQNDISIYKLSSGGSTPTTVAAPTAAPEAGAVAAGTKVKLSAEAGATIYYTTDGSEPTTTSAPYGADSDGITIDKALTIKASAVKDGVSSTVATFAYTIKSGEVTEGPLKDGAQVVIYNPANLKALSTTYTGFYNNGTDITLENGVPVGYTDADVWTVGVNEDGSYTFSTSEGKKLAMGASYTSTPLDEANPNWNVTPAKTADCFYIKNTVRGNYLEWYASKNNWSAPQNLGEEALFAQAFYVIPPQREEGIVTELFDGDTVVVFNPSNMKALSTTYTGFYNNGTDVTLADGKLSGYTAADIWTVGVNEDGSYTFSTSEGKKLAMGASYTSTPLDEVNPNWNVTPAKTADCFYIKNTVRGNYLEWYASKNNWSAPQNLGEEALFAQQFYLVVNSGSDPTPGGLPNEGDKVVLYNLNSKGVLAAQDDNATSPSINGVGATIADGKATPENGGVIFTVEKNGEYYRFKNDTYGYLCSNGTGNNAFYQAEATDDADWLVRTCSGGVGGFELESRTAKFNGKYSQWLEYYGTYKTYSMYNVTDYTIYSFSFYPVADGVNVTEGIVNDPKVDFGTLADAYVGMDYTLRFTVDAIFGVQGGLTVKLGGEELTYQLENGEYAVTIPAEKISGESLSITVSGTDTKGVAFSGTANVTVKDEPVISDLKPAAGSQTGTEKKPTISATITNAGETPTVEMTVGGTKVGSSYNTATGVVSYTPANDLPDGRTTVIVTVKRADGKEVSKSWSFTVGTSQYQLYFGQLHSHTGQYSDGSGTLQEGLDYVNGLPENANVDFVAFTDHSNYFDKSGEANPEDALYDMTKASTFSQNQWKEYKDTVAAFNESQSDIVALAGFEMTWSGGPGHINTFNTPGIVSRNNTTLNNKTADAGMQAYYALLSQPEGVDSLSQFNHPGKTFGTFADFAYYNPTIDSRMYMVEVGNGEGQIGAGGYYPSYEQYTVALDKGWHLAPTNNQDNHKGKWGNANDARDVILTDNFTEQGLYEAIRQLHMYASEDKNLEISYTVNGQQMGAQLPKDTESLAIEVTVNDPDSNDSISKVEVIVNSGRVAYTWSNPTELATGTLTATLKPEYSYYFIRVTEGDGDLAVTAPVWIGEVQKLGISAVECGTSTPVTNEELTITTTLFNSETTDATVKSLTYTVGDTVLGTDNKTYTLGANSTLEVNFQYTPTVAKVMDVLVTAVVEQGGTEYTYTKSVTLDVLNADSLVYIGIDASHYNEYVAGNYKDSMGNFGLLAAGYSVRTVELETSANLIAACENADGKYKMIILTAPSRRDGTALRNPYATYSDAEIQALTKFNQAGGTLVFTGWSDYYEHYSSFPAADHMAAQQNKVLAALGSSLRVSDDGVNDDILNGGQSQRLYFNTYGDSFLTEGVEVDPDHPNDRLYTEVFSHYGGASIYVVDAAGNASSNVPSTVTPVVYGHSSTDSKDSDKDGLGGTSVPKYAASEGNDRLMMFATEQLEGKGLIVVAGAAFMSNFEVQAAISDNGSEKNYSNYKICENLVQYVNPVTTTPIADVRAQTEEGYKYTIEGVVTSNASGYDKATAFFDCIYVQDETGGICCFPVAGDFKVGDKVRVTGTTDFFQGEPELQVTSITKLGETTPVKPTAITAAQLNDRSAEGKLVTVSGKVTEITMANGLPESIYVKDASGNVARVFIDGYITNDKTIENLKVECSIEATGLASYDDTYADKTAFPRIRIRDRADIICTAATTPVDPPVKPTRPVRPTTPVKEELPFVDVAERDWFYEDVEYVYNEGIMNGTGRNRFSPDAELTRGMVVTILYRIENEPVAGKADMFGDVPNGQWYTKAVAWAAENGIVNGYPNGNFGPDDAITREQLAAILYRYTKFKGELRETRRDYLGGFSDVEDVSAYAVSAMNWAVGAELIMGSNNKLLPREHATRAQVAAIIHRYLER